MTVLLSALQTVGAVLGIWTLVAVVTAVVMIPWFRAQARANAVLSAHARSADWLVAAHPANVHKNATR